MNRLKRWAIVAGHDFKHPTLNSVGYRHKDGLRGIICYNCGVWTVHSRWPEKVEEMMLHERLPQCPYNQMDLFGGMAFLSKDLPKQVPRRKK